MPQNYTIGGGHIEQPRDDTAPAILDEIERKALNNVIDVRVDEVELRRQAAAEESLVKEHTASTPAAGGASAPAARASSTPEASVYADLATEALGGTAARLVKDGLSLLTDRADPAAGVSIGGRKIQTFEDLIEGAARAPGHYGESPASPRARRPLLEDDDEADSQEIVARTNIAGQSVTGQSDSVRTWAISKPRMPSAELVLQQTAQYRLASEKTLEAVHRARAVQAPAMGQMQRMGRIPAMNADLSQGPKFIPPRDSDDDSGAAAGSAA